MSEYGFKVAIPARYGSTRLPGKPLREIAGRPMIEHVHRRALAAGAEEVVIATDDERIRRVAEGFGARVCMTAPDHASGTDRLAEVAATLGWAADEIVVNLQGDEPLMPAQLLRQVAVGLDTHPEAGICTVCAPIQEARAVFDPHIVKVVLDERGFALYFSRAPIPYWRDGFAEGTDRLPEGVVYRRHIGLYAYRVEALARYPTLAVPALERAESLEQLRALAHGIPIRVEQASRVPPLGVDTEADLTRVEAYLAGGVS